MVKMMKNKSLFIQSINKDLFTLFTSFFTVFCRFDQTSTLEFKFCFIINIYLNHMSSTDIQSYEQDELQLPKRIKVFNQKKRTFKFISDINQKLQKIHNGEIPEKLQMLKIKNCSKLEGVLDKNQPFLNKNNSSSETLRNFQKQNLDSNDPEVMKAAMKMYGRKKLTIQKKQSNDDPLQGKGVIKLKDGQVVFGTWLNGNLQGQAKVVYPNGDIYSGEMKDNLKHGTGTYKFYNGNKYEGHFDKGHFTGFGVLSDPFGEVLYRGLWNNGVLIQGIY